MLYLGWKLQNLSLRMLLLSEAARERSQGWRSVPGWAQILRWPHRYEVILLSQRPLKAGQPVTLVDVGANTGEWGERFRHYITASYAGFEPDPSAFTQLVKRYPAATLHNCCVGSQIVPVRLNLWDLSTYTSISEYDERVDTDHRQSSIAVAQLRFDQYDFGKDPLVLKIDVQCAKREVLEGAVGILDNVWMIILEDPLFRNTAVPNSLADVVSLLASRGFHPSYLCHAGMLWGRNTIPLEHDILFVNTRFSDPNPLN